MNKLQKSQLSSSIFSNSKSDADKDEPDENLTVFSLPSHEVVISIDHILEHIFSYVDTSDLFTCRLVSYRFLEFAQIPLEKRVYLVFCDYLQKTSDETEVTGRTLPQLTRFLRRSPASKASSKSTAKIISFPCTSFIIQKVKIDDLALQNFFIAYGKRIQQLQLQVQTVYDDSLLEIVLMYRLNDLLTWQAPNLENFDICVNPIVQWNQDSPPRVQDAMSRYPSYRSQCSALYTTDSEFQQMSRKVESSRKKSSLKIVEIDGVGLAKTIEYLIQVSPQLQEVIVDRDNYVHLVHPVNRVHLLKSLRFVPTLRESNPSEVEDENTSYYRFDMETMKTISLDKNLRLRELGICFFHVLLELKTNREFENKVVSMINKILEGSKDTLEILTLVSYSMLSGMKMPASMPNVSKIEIMNFEESRDASSTLFPKGFSLCEAFPKLTSVILTHIDDLEDFNHFYDFLKCLDFGGDGEGSATALSLGVKEVILEAPCFRTEGFTAIPPFICERIQKLFPSASIEV